MVVGVYSVSCAALQNSMGNSNQTACKRNVKFRRAKKEAVDILLEHGTKLLDVEHAFLKFPMSISNPGE